MRINVVFGFKFFFIMMQTCNYLLLSEGISRDDADNDDNDKQTQRSLLDLIYNAQPIEIKQILLHKSNIHIGSIIIKSFFQRKL